MLAGIGADDLESLLEFVYRGEVSVEPSQLPSLLQAAHCLCIHGLTPPTIVTEVCECLYTFSFDLWDNIYMPANIVIRICIYLFERSLYLFICIEWGRGSCISNTDSKRGFI